jgi:glyoxylase-like metal-dependent hydrolase (beta-lactamase superfamily II)
MRDGTGMNPQSNNNWQIEVLLQGSWRGATSVLISNACQRILVDSGMPHEAHLLMKALGDKGLRPADITALISTHFHVDHVLNNHLFGSAIIYATQQSYDWCRSMYSDIADDQNWEKLALKYYPEMNEYEKTRQHMARLRKFALRWWDVKSAGSAAQFRWLETESLPDGIASWITSGHVPGHASLVVQSSERPTIIAGDALLSRDKEDQVATMIPHDRRQSLADRSRILEMGGRILPGHDSAFNGCSSSRPDDRIPEICAE